MWFHHSQFINSDDPEPEQRLPPGIGVRIKNALRNEARDVGILWVHGHIGILGNWEADRGAEYHYLLGNSQGRHRSAHKKGHEPREGFSGGRPTRNQNTASEEPRGTAMPPRPSPRCAQIEAHRRAGPTSRVAPLAHAGIPQRADTTLSQIPPVKNGISKREVHLGRDRSGSRREGGFSKPFGFLLSMAAD